MSAHARSAAWAVAVAMDRGGVADAAAAAARVQGAGSPGHTPGVLRQQEPPAASSVGAHYARRPGTAAAHGRRHAGNRPTTIVPAPLGPSSGRRGEPLRAALRPKGRRRGAATVATHYGRQPGKPGTTRAWGRPTRRPMLCGRSFVCRNAALRLWRWRPTPGSAHGGGGGGGQRGDPGGGTGEEGLLAAERCGFGKSVKPSGAGM